MSIINCTAYNLQKTITFNLDIICCVSDYNDLDIRIFFTSLLALLKYKEMVMN